MGVVLYEALAGCLPFEASNDLALLRMQAEEPPPLVDGLSTPMQTLLARALAKDPDARPPDATTLLAELEAAAAAEEGGDWKKRAGLAALVASAATGIDELVAPTPAGAVTPGSDAAAQSPHAVTSAAKGGLLASHPMLTALSAVVLVGALALGGVAIAHGGSASPTAARASSANPPTFTSVERAVCERIGISDSEGDHCAILSMKVSNANPDWVHVEGLGYYSGSREHPDEQQARSDLDEALYNVSTTEFIGPTNVGFCNPAGPVDLSAVPAPVLSGWGLDCGHSSGTTTTTPASTTTAQPPATTTTTNPAVSSTTGAAASTFGAFEGSWGAHEQELTISASGAGQLNYADLTLCPSCSFGSAPRSTMDFQLTSTSGESASGKITAASDSQEYAVGTSVTLQLTSGSPGVILQLSAGSTSQGTYCNSTSAGQCGA